MTRSKEAFDQLYESAYTGLFRTALAIVGEPAAAEDCVQDACLRAFKAWPRFREDAPAEAWLHRIALNVAISYRRRERLRSLPETLLRLGRPREEGEIEPEGGVFQALRSLPLEQAQLIVLRYHHGYSNRELAAALGVPETTLGSRLTVARRALQAELAKLGIVTSGASRVVTDEETS